MNVLNERTAWWLVLVGLVGIIVVMLGAWN